MYAVDKYFPVQGSNKFQTYSFPITKAFHVDLKGSTAGTHTCFTVPAGSIVLGFAARVSEALESSGITVQVGFTGVGSMLSTAHASGAATVGTIITGNSNSALSSKTTQMVYIPTADDTFDVITSGAMTTASGYTGELDVYLTYIPLPTAVLTTADALSYSF